MIQNTIKLELMDEVNGKVIHHTFPFEVQENVQSMGLQLHHRESIWGTYLVYDPADQLRAQYVTGKTPQPIVIHEQLEKTSPYTTSGSIAAGMWKIEIIASVNDQEVIEKPFIEVQFNTERTDQLTNELYWNEMTGNLGRIIQNEARWYKGDFHTHTIYSDGQMTREENMASAKNQQLDFFVATDHNIVPTSWVNDSSVLVLPGIEVTAPLGHFNILNTNRSPFEDCRLGDMLTEQGMNNIMDGHYGNALISINHPFLTEWKWLYNDTPLNKVDTLEVWNDPTYGYNPQATEWALIAWDMLLKDGHRITGIGGSDSHLKPEERYEDSEEASLIGDPGTFVYCEGLSVNNLITAVKQGHVVVSRGEKISLQLEQLIAGDQSDKSTGEIKVSVDTNEAIEIEWVVDGDVVSKVMDNHASYPFNWSDDAYHYIRVNVRRADGTLYGFTNPIYFNEKEPSLRTWGQLLEFMKEHRAFVTSFAQEHLDD